MSFHPKNPNSALDIILLLWHRVAMAQVAGQMTQVQAVWSSTGWCHGSILLIPTLKIERSQRPLFYGCSMGKGKGAMKCTTKSQKRRNGREACEAHYFCVAQEGSKGEGCFTTRSSSTASPRPFFDVEVERQWGPYSLISLQWQEARLVRMPCPRKSLNILAAQLSRSLGPPPRPKVAGQTISYTTAVHKRAREGGR